MTTRAATPPRLPGHAAANIGLAAAIWLIGVNFTRTALPLEGPVVPWLAAIALQALLSVAQTNIRIFGLSVSGWPFLVLVILDVALNASGLLVSYIDGVDTIADAGLYLVRAVTTGQGIWQCVAAAGVGALIACSPEQMIRAGLGKAP